VAGHPVPRPDALGALLITGGVAALVLGLVKGSSWGWADGRTLAALAAGVVASALFALHTLRHRNPLIDRALFKLRPFVGASAVAVFFSAAFGAMLLSRVLWMQDVWHWSALTTGLAIAPGPLMVPLFSFLVAGRLTTRLGAGPVIAAGSTVFAAGAAWWALAIGMRPDYAGEMLGGMLLTGIGVGLTLPTLMATGASSLPPHAFATGSAVVNMLRQVGLAIGVAALIAVIGAPRSPLATLIAYEHATWMVAAIAFVGGMVGLGLLAARHQPSPIAASGDTIAPAVAIATSGEAPRA
jgi:MFS family permease